MQLDENSKAKGVDVQSNTNTNIEKAEKDRPVYEAHDRVWSVVVELPPAVPF